MDFLTNVLPSAKDNWVITNGSFSDAVIILHTNGSAVCTITEKELPYIPKAFQVRVQHDSNTSWKHPDIYVMLQVLYEDKTTSTSLVPLNADQEGLKENLTAKTVLLSSKKFTKLKYTLTNPSSDDITFTLFELRPSVDMDSSLYNNVETMLAQLVYTSNSIPVTCAAAVASQVLQIQVAVRQNTNLLLHLTLTGDISTTDTVSCTISIDGRVCLGFPIKQVLTTGAFFLGIPSIVAFVTTGSHIVSVSLKTSTTASITIETNKAVIILEGKNVLGGASSIIPHAEVSQNILIANMLNTITQSVTVTQVTPNIQAISCSILKQNANLNSQVSVNIAYGGDIIMFASLTGAVPPIVDYDDTLYYTDYAGLHPYISKDFDSIKEVKADFTEITVDVDLTAYTIFNQRYTEV